ncbi:MAG: preprotein translocase subunit SecE [Alphaproteobacteria bacterium]|nr:preprotein translocase subunit SecE [Alphaproteobacteria bacterium]
MLARIAHIGTFFGEVRQELFKITWPKRREAIMTSVFVFVMVVLASIFFLLVDQAFGFLIRQLLSI